MSRIDNADMPFLCLIDNGPGQLALKNIQMDQIRFLVIQKTGEFSACLTGIEKVNR